MFLSSKKEVEMDEAISNSPKKNKVDFSLLLEILRLENLACFEKVFICLYFVVCFMLRIYLKM